MKIKACEKFGFLMSKNNYKIAWTMLDAMQYKVDNPKTFTYIDQLVPADPQQIKSRLTVSTEGTTPISNKDLADLMVLYSDFSYDELKYVPAAIHMMIEHIFANYMRADFGYGRLIPKSSTFIGGNGETPSHLKNCIMINEPYIRFGDQMTTYDKNSVYSFYHFDKPKIINVSPVPNRPFYPTKNPLFSDESKKVYWQQNSHNGKASIRWKDTSNKSRYIVLDNFGQKVQYLKKELQPYVSALIDLYTENDWGLQFSKQDAIKFLHKHTDWSLPACDRILMAYKNAMRYIISNNQSIELGKVGIIGGRVSRERRIINTLTPTTSEWIGNMKLSGEPFFQQNLDHLKGYAFLGKLNVALMYQDSQTQK